MATFIKIETVAGEYTQEFIDSVLPIKVPGNYTKQDTIDKYIAEERVKRMGRLALDPLFNRIVCISVINEEEDGEVGEDGVPVVHSFYDETLGPIVTQFFDWFGNIKGGYYRPVVTYNLHFTVNSIICGAIKIQDIHRQLECTALDNRDAFPDLKIIIPDNHNLITCAKVFGIDINDMPGEQVQEHFTAGDIQGIVDRCESHVKVMQWLYNKIDAFYE